MGIRKDDKLIIRRGKDNKASIKGQDKAGTGGRDKADAEGRDKGNIGKQDKASIKRGRDDKASIRGEGDNKASTRKCDNKQARACYTVVQKLLRCSFFLAARSNSFLAFSSLESIID